MEGDDPARMHEEMAAKLDEAVEQIRAIQKAARAEGDPAGGSSRPRWPMIVLRSPKGWTGPKMVDGVRIEGTFSFAPGPALRSGKNPEHLRQLEAWLQSYRPQELFDDQGRLRPELAELAPRA